MFRVKLLSNLSGTAERENISRSPQKISVGNDRQTSGALTPATDGHDDGCEMPRQRQLTPGRLRESWRFDPWPEQFVAAAGFGREDGISRSLAAANLEPERLALGVEGQDLVVHQRAVSLIEWPKDNERGRDVGVGNA